MVIVLATFAAITDYWTSTDDKFFLRNQIEPFFLVLKVLMGIAVTLMVAVVFAVSDRLSLSSPIEEDLAQGLIRMDGNIDKLSKSIKTLKQSNDETFEGFFQKAKGYQSYIDARSGYGFQSIVGHRPKGDFDSLTTGDLFSIEIFKVNPPAYEIMYMNSFITHDDSYLEAIEDAVKRGTSVRMLLMKPDPRSGVVMARYKDCYEKLGRYDDYDHFVRDIAHKYDKFRRLSIRFKDAKSRDGRMASFELRYYNLSLDQPMIIVRKNKSSRHPDNAYTGFYTRMEAGEMPYIEWGPGKFQMVDKFHEMFKAKWDACEGNDDVTPGLFD